MNIYSLNSLNTSTTKEKSVSVLPEVEVEIFSWGQNKKHMQQLNRVCFCSPETRFRHVFICLHICYPFWCLLKQKHTWQSNWVCFSRPQLKISTSTSAKKDPWKRDLTLVILLWICHVSKSQKAWLLRRSTKKPWHNQVHTWGQFWCHISWSSKILKMFIKYVFSQFWWSSYVTSKLTSLIGETHCVKGFFVNLLPGLVVWLFDISHLFDNLTSSWHFDTWLII